VARDFSEFNFQMSNVRKGNAVMGLSALPVDAGLLQGGRFRGSDRTQAAENTAISFILNSNKNGAKILAVGLHASLAKGG
jgi:hypothetical protein